MPTSLYIVVEGEDPGFDIFVNGHALARNEDALERLAERLGVSPLLEFFSADENSMALLLEQGLHDVLGIVQCENARAVQIVDALGLERQARPGGRRGDDDPIAGQNQRLRQI